jgi:hypothetical protein
MHIGGIFCDISKATDCENRGILLDKLYFYGIQWAAVDRFRSYPTERKQNDN